MADVSKDQLREYLRWTDALLRSMELAVRSEDSNYIWKHFSFKQFARKYNQIVTEVAKSVPLPPIIDLYNLDAMLGPNDTTAPDQKAKFEGVHANVAILKSFLEGRIGVVEDETVALRDFFQARLRSAIFRVPEKEREVQDAIEQLLIGRGLQKGQDYDREVGRVKISVKESVPDFILLRLGLGVEVKLASAASRVREIVDEINADMAAYSKGYRSLLFIVYDLGHIRDEVEFRHDLESSGNVSVIVVKH